MKIKLVKNETQGFDFAKKLLYEKADFDTVLFLCGGRTPKPLYTSLAREEKLKIGAIAMLDERYSFHQQYSNEVMIKESGLVGFAEKKSIGFYPILKYGVGRIDTAKQYDKTVRDLFNSFPKRIGVFGIGVDGHIAGLPAGFAKESEDYAQEYDNFPIDPNERITLSLKAISQLDWVIVLAFGEEKLVALRKMFEKGSVKQIPARFLDQKLSKKTILITDQKL